VLGGKDLTDESLCNGPQNLDTKKAFA
jgi:hypothetical protein